MALYYPEYNKAREAVFSMDEDGLLSVLDDLYGRDNLPNNYTLDELRLEALDQTRREFTDTSSPEYQQVQFWTGLHRIAA